MLVNVCICLMIMMSQQDPSLNIYGFPVELEGFDI